MSIDPNAHEARRFFDRIYRFLLRLYPADFREKYGLGMEQTFSERMRNIPSRRRRSAALLLTIRESWSVLTTATAQHLRGVLRRISTRRSSTIGVTGVQKTGGHIKAFLQELHYAGKALKKSHGYTLVAVLTLALGIGANTAIFSVVNGVLLKPLPYHEPDRLIEVWETGPQDLGWGFSPPNFLSYRSEVRLVDDIVAYTATPFTLTGIGEPERLPGMQVSAGFFPLLGVSLQMGRHFLPADDLAESRPVTIISHGFWQRRFGGAPDVLGSTLSLNGVAREVIGIAPPNFVFFNDAIELWTPMEFSTRELAGRGRHYLFALARLGDGVEIDAAVREFNVIANHLGEAFPETNSGWGTEAASLHGLTVGGVKKPLWIILGAVGVVLLIACANVANLSLARAEGRSREMALRSALGASQLRIRLSLLLESILLGLAAGIAGVVLAYGCVTILVTAFGSEIPRVGEISIDRTVLFATTAVSLLAGFLVGIASAMRVDSNNLQAALRDSGQHSTASRKHRKLGSTLVVVEVALALSLVIGAMLLLKSFWILTNVGTGFTHEGLLTASISLPESQYPTDVDRREFFANLVEGVQTATGTSVAAATGLPFVGGRNTTISTPRMPDQEIRGIQRRRVTFEYFSTMGIPILAGRTFDAGDTPNAPHVVVINEALARRVSPNETALGKQILWGGPHGPETLEIIGIVGNVKHHGFAADAAPAMYLEYTQIYVSDFMYLVVRSSGNPIDLLPTIRSLLYTLDPSVPLYRVATMEQLISDSVSGERFPTVLLATSAVAALILGAIGVFSVLSYTVSKRTKEVGVRIALGAARTNVVLMVLRQGMTLVFAGIILGIATSLVLSRLLDSMLFGVSPTDPITFLSVMLLVLMIALAACYLPAIRAARVDPLETLRYE